METRSKILSLAIATALVGCGSTPEKLSSDMGVESERAISRQVVATEQADVAQVVSMPVAIAPAADVPHSVVVAPSAPVIVTPAPVAHSVSEIKTAHKIPTTPNTFLVTSELKTQEHPDYGHGQEVGFVVNGGQGKELAVVRGEKYKFIVSTGVQHDFYLTTSPSGWGVGTYTEGVEGQFIFRGEVSFAPGTNAPGLLHYQCRNHKYMGGKIYVLNKGDDLAKVKSAMAEQKADTAKGVKRVMAVTEGAVKQKLSYAQMVMVSSSAKRVEESGSTDAITMLGEARQQVESAKTMLAGGKLEDAMGHVDAGLRLMTAASRAITTESDIAAVDHKVKHDELVSSLKTYDASYAKNIAYFNKKKQPVKNKLDEVEYGNLVSSGRSQASKGDYMAANKDLGKAQTMITTVLTEMLHAQTVVYETTFDDPKEQYEHELARVESYEELVPLAIEQKEPNERTLGLIEDFVKKAAQIKAEGQSIAAKGDYKMAIMAMEAATSNLQRALRLAGVN